MTIIHGIIGSVQGASGGGGGAKSISNIWYTTGSSEGYSTDINIDYNNWDGSAIYWQVVGKGGTPATSGTDFTGTLSGIFTPIGTGTYTVTTVSFVADVTTEGNEGWGADAGSYSGGSDYWNGTTWTITDLSTAPVADFTIEWWQKMNSSQSAQYPRLFDIGSHPSENPGISFESSWIYVWGGGSSDSVSSAYLGDTYNTWTHWAIERHNNTIALYKNGNNILSTNNLGPIQINDSTNPLTIGYGSGMPWNGKVTNFHWVKGHAKYQTSFTPALNPIPPTPNTKLLLGVADDTNKYADRVGLHAVNSTGSVAFDSDTPFTVPSAVSTTLLGVGGDLGVFNYVTGLENVRPGWTISNTTNGYTGVVTSKDSNTNLHATPDWTNDSSEYTFTPPTSVSHATGASGQGQYWELQFSNVAQYDLLSVRAGWIATCGGYTDVVVVDVGTYDDGAYRVKLSQATSSPPVGTWTFTPYTATGSLVFNGGYVSTPASTDFAIDG